MTALYAASAGPGIRLGAQSSDAAPWTNDWCAQSLSNTSRSYGR